MDGLTFLRIYSIIVCFEKRMNPASHGGRSTFEWLMEKRYELLKPLIEMSGTTFSNWKGRRSQMNMIEAIFLFISTQTQLLLSWSAHKLAHFPRELRVALFLGLRPRNVLHRHIQNYPILSRRIQSPPSGIRRGEGAKRPLTSWREIWCVLYIYIVRGRCRSNNCGGSLPLGTIDRFHLKMGERQFPIHEVIMLFSCRNRKWPLKSEYKLST